MTRIKLRYVVKKRGRLFWQPTREMQEHGFLPRSLGVDGPAAHEEASKLYAAWLEAREKATKVTDYPPGSLGAYYDRFRRSRTWARKQERTREDYVRAWTFLEPTFARKTITKIAAADVEAFVDKWDGVPTRQEIEAARRAGRPAPVAVPKWSPAERYRTLKSFRALLNDAFMRLEITRRNPALAVTNPQPRGRSAIWLGAEIEVLVSAATAGGYGGMAVAIRIAWDTLFSPVDVRTLPLAALKSDSTGRYVERLRTKTKKEAFGALSQATAEAIDAYIAGLGFELTPETPFIRQRNGSAYRSKDTFGDDFRAVRRLAFPGDTRQFLDIRRSGNVEADAAGADKVTMGEILANGLATSAFLDETYTPPTVAKARTVADQRLEGRRKLAGEATRIRSKTL